MSSANVSSQEKPGSSSRQPSSSRSSPTSGSDLKSDSSRHRTQKMVGRSPQDMKQEAEAVADSSAKRTNSNDATREADEWLRAKEDAYAKIAARNGQRRRRPAQLLDEARRKPRSGESESCSLTCYLEFRSMDGQHRSALSSEAQCRAAKETPWRPSIETARKEPATSLAAV